MIDLETAAIVGSILGSAMSLTGVLLNHRYRRAHPRVPTVVITIEDSAGGRARTVARTDKRAHEVKREVERVVSDAN